MKRGRKSSIGEAPKSKWKGYEELEGDSDSSVHTSKPEKRIDASFSEKFILGDVFRALDRKTGKRCAPSSPSSLYEDCSQEKSWVFFAGAS